MLYKSATGERALVAERGTGTEVRSQTFPNCHGGKIAVDYDIGIVSQGILSIACSALK